MRTRPTVTAALLGLALGAASALGGLTGSLPALAQASQQAVVVTAERGSLASVVTAVERAGGTVVAPLPLIDGVSARLPAGATLPPFLQVVPDRALQLAGRKDPQQQAADVSGPVSTVRATLGLPADGREGGKVRVAVVDTGVADVADLAGRLTHVDVTGRPSSRRDALGHGTFVAGLVAGDGSASDGSYVGVAPRASVLDVKVADDSGATSLVTVLAGLQAVADDGKVDVLNLSLASGSPLPYQVDPLTQALERLWERGVVVVVPAGNDGPTAGSIASPGLDPVLLTVGGLDENGSRAHGDDAVPDWSARGPAPQGVAKPDLVAPGRSLVSTLAPDSAAQAAQTRTDLPAGYAVGSGTSFATAVASGAAAALLGERRGLSPDQVKALLTATAYRTSALTDRDAAGAGGLDVAAALSAKAPKVAPTRLLPRPSSSDVRAWTAVLRALGERDQAAAEQAWAGLDRRQQEWAASLWAARSPEANAWSASLWAALGWPADAQQSQLWGARIWAASNWAASSWAASNWAASSWAASSWAASNWASLWAGTAWGSQPMTQQLRDTATWAAHSWAASSWGASNWAASNWAASSWAASSWAASNWAASNWAASSWATTGWS